MSEIPTGFARWSIVGAAVLGTAVFDLTWMIVGVALPHMQGTFSSTPDQIAWVMTSFIVGGTMMIAATGWASTRFGRKRIYVVALAGNTVATAMCGAAGSLEAEVFWRFVQGMLSAPLLALSQSITIDAFPEEKRSFATGVWGAAGVSAVVLAPVLGGYLVDNFNWRWVFYANVPLGILATLCAWAFIPPSPPNPARRLEFLGLITVIVLIGSLQLALSRGERLDWTESNEIRVQLTIAALAFVALVIVTCTARQPFLERGIFLDRNYLVSIVFMLLFGGMVTLPVVLLPLMLQQVNGYPAITAGVLMLPRGVGSVISLLLAGVLLSRFDARAVLAVGFGCAALSNWFMSTWNADIDEWSVIWANLVQGLSSGATYVPIVSISLATLAKRLHTEAITFMFLVFNLGSAIGVAAIFALHTRLVQINYSVLAEHVTPTNERWRHLTMPDAWDMDTQSGLAALAAEILHQAELIAYLNAFLVVGIFALGAIPLILLVRARDDDANVQ